MVKVEAQSCSNVNNLETSKKLCLDASKAATADATIEKKVCPQTGKITYVRKETIGEKGTIIYNDVAYNEHLDKFVNVSPSKKEVSAKSVFAINNGDPITKDDNNGVNKKDGKKDCKDKKTVTKKDAKAKEKTDKNPKAAKKLPKSSRVKFVSNTHN